MSKQRRDGASGVPAGTRKEKRKQTSSSLNVAPVSVNDEGSSAVGQLKVAGRARSRSDAIKVMLSSKCLPKLRLLDENGNVAEYELTVLRKAVVKKLEDFELGGRYLFSVWANEFAEPAPLEISSWDECIEHASKCDVFISLDGGDAGWWKDGETSGSGICHEELRAAVESGRGKVRIVKVKSIVPTSFKTSDEKRLSAARDRRFRDYMVGEGLDPFVSSVTETDTFFQAVEKVCDAVSSVVVDLVMRGKSLTRQSRLAAGEALAWARQDLVERGQSMVKVLKETLAERTKKSIADLPCVGLTLTESFSNSWAREQLGRPFLEKQSPVGSLIVIACYRSLTETQARAFLGHSAVMTVGSNFGVFARDLRMHAQVVFLKNCRDSSALKSRLQNALSWIETTLSDVQAVRKRRIKIESMLG